MAGHNTSACVRTRPFVLLLTVACGSPGGERDQQLLDTPDRAQVAPAATDVSQTVAPAPDSLAPTPGPSDAELSFEAELCIDLLEEGNRLDEIALRLDEIEALLNQDGAVLPPDLQDRTQALHARREAIRERLAELDAALLELEAPVAAEGRAPLRQIEAQVAADVEQLDAAATEAWQAASATARD